MINGGSSGVKLFKGDNFQSGLDRTAKSQGLTIDMLKLIDNL
jgi:hypothetical protein